MLQVGAIAQIRRRAGTARAALIARYLERLAVHDDFAVAADAKSLTVEVRVGHRCLNRRAVPRIAQANVPELAMIEHRIEF